MKRVLVLVLGAALFGIMAAVVVAQVGQDPSQSGTTAGTTVEEGTTTAEDLTTTTEDRRGDDDRGRDDRDDDPPGDISGPCDEAAGG
jgi:hypothetical protein